MRVEIWSDLVCPWCYIGTARFEQALAGFEHRADVEVVHRSFELDPHRERTEPVADMLVDMLVEKFGAGGVGLDGKVAAVAHGDGLAYVSDREVGNTVDAHRLLHLARERGVEREVLQAMYRAHFAEGRSLFTPEALTKVAVDAGLDEDDVRRVLESDAYLDAVRADEREAARLGANGVPFFVVDGRYGISGAQPVELFTKALETAWADRPVAVLQDVNACSVDGC
ncbi:DsbA family oxidoreductase [Saccharothrix variisporea]|uniref:Putative DsbA family dithiol-disulfide isomerase n=1 Tax=Saccharothrix variisporea TaxID=543527 RepID=A0A495X3U7_9PSEU|nr:putative DsbA family dithiol-disulfide isomerase [Saccharothrix variisporea]